MSRPKWQFDDEPEPQESINEEELAAEFLKEFNLLEEFRLQTCLEILELCKSMKALRDRLTPRMIAALIDNRWKEGELTKALNRAVNDLLSALKCVDKPLKMESITYVTPPHLMNPPDDMDAC